MSEIKFENGQAYKLVFTPYIVRKGKVIYPKKSKFFRFWAKVK
jgi:hypothetical protein